MCICIYIYILYICIYIYIHIYIYRYTFVHSTRRCSHSEEAIDKYNQLLCVLLGHVPDWNNKQKLGQLQVELLFVLICLQLHWIRCTFFFVVSAARLCSCLEEYTNNRRSEIRVTTFFYIYN